MNQRPTINSAMIGILAIGLGLVVAASKSTRAQSPAAPESSPWSAELGGFNGLADLAPVSATDIHAVGGSLVHSDGVIWRSVDGRESPGPYRAVDFVGPDEGWAVGNGVAVPFRSGAWGASVALPDVALVDIDLIDPGRGWAVGWDGAKRRAAVLELHDGEWRSRPLLGDVPDTLEGVWMASPTEGWAVGADVVVHFDGAVWTGTRLPGIVGLHAVVGSSARDVWAVGGPEPRPFVDPGPALIVHFDGTRWTTDYDAALGGLAAVTIQGNDGYAVGYEGVVLRHRDGRWDSLGRIIGADRFFEVAAVKWVPGTAYALAVLSDGRVYRLDDGHATLVWSSTAMTGIAMASAHQGWALSRAGAMQYDGTRWSLLDATSPLQKARDIVAVAPDDAWAVGVDGLILHFDGMSWQSVASPTSVTLDRVHMVSPTLGWAVGNGVAGTRTAPIQRAVVLRYDGRGWSTIWDRSTSTWHPLFDASGATLDDAWVADEDGLWHFDGASWRQQGVALCCRSVAMVSSTDGWAGGKQGIFHFDGKEWISAASLADSIDAISVESDGSGWAAGFRGYVLYRAGAGADWRVVRGPAGLSGVPWGLSRLSAVHDGVTSRVWVAGEQRSILTADLAALLRRPPLTPYVGETAIPFTPMANDTPTPTPAAGTPDASASPFTHWRAICLPWAGTGLP